MRLDSYFKILVASKHIKQVIGQTFLTAKAEIDAK